MQATNPIAVRALWAEETIEPGCKAVPMAMASTTNLCSAT
jgi:hypothetical protein